MAATETYPDDLKYHREHDWARIQGDEAVLGITWFAQDALGEITNMTAGNVKAMISPTLTIAPPSVVEGVDYKVRIPGTELVHQTFFQCDGVPFGVSIHQKT